MQVKEISIGWAMTQPNVAAALDRVFANIRSLSGKSKTWLDARSDYFSRFSLPFGRKVLSLQRSTNSEIFHSVGHRSIVQQYCRAFFMPSLYLYRRLPFRKYTIARWVKSLFVDQRDVQPLSVSPRRRFRQWSINSAIMQVKEISIGWAMTQPNVAAALDRVFANIRSLSDKSTTWLDARSDYFSRFSLPFGRKVLSLQRYKDDGNPSVRAHVRRSASKHGHFLCSIASVIAAAIPKENNCPRVSHRLCSNGMCSRFLYLRASGTGSYKDDAFMQVKEISIGWAMTQPNVAAALGRVFANIRSLSDKSTTWLDARSETFTTLCGTEGEEFTRRDVVRAHLYLVAVFLMMCLAGWLEGGAA